MGDLDMTIKRADGSKEQGAARLLNGTLLGMRRADGSLVTLQNGDSLTFSGFKGGPVYVSGVMVNGVEIPVAVRHLVNDGDELGLSR